MSQPDGVVDVPGVSIDAITVTLTRPQADLLRLMIAMTLSRFRGWALVEIEGIEAQLPVNTPRHASWGVRT